MKRTGKRGLLLLAACALFLGACEKEDHDATVQPSPAALSAFEAQFPDAREVRWERIRDYDVAEFSLATPQRHNAWYAPGSGACALTEIDMTQEQLAAEAPGVLASWLASTYKAAGYVLDDIDRLTYADREPVYQLEIEYGEAERELTYAADGTLLSDREDDAEAPVQQPCPQAIVDFVDTHYPMAVIADFEVENRQGVLYYEVEIFHQQEKKELLFDANYTFLICVVEIEEPSSLPEPVLAALLALAPDTDSWDDLSRYEDQKGVVAAYVLKVEEQATGRERLIKVDPAGNPIE